MRKSFAAFILAGLILVCSQGIYANGFTLTALSNSAQSGLPGQTVGWEFQIVNDSQWYMFPDYSAPVFDLNGTVLDGTWSWTPTYLAPGSVTQLDFSLDLLADFTIGVSAQPDVNAYQGEFFFRAFYYNDENLLDPVMTSIPGTIPIQFSEEERVPVSLQVLEGAPPLPDVPEPSSLILLGTGVLGVAGMVVRRRK